MYIDSNSKIRGDLLVEVPSIKNAIKNILLTRKGTLPGDPEFGSRLPDYLFEPFDDLTVLEIKDEIINTLARYEPRVKIITIDVNHNFDFNSLDILLYFSLVRTNEEYDLNLRLQNN